MDGIANLRLEQGAAHVLGIDLSSKMIEEAKKRVMQENK